MRRPKFRAWDTANNCWYQPVFKAYQNELYELLISFSGDLDMRTMNQVLEHESRFPDRFILMQYTGLTDRNGKDIYEGDVIKSEIYNTIGEKFIVDDIIKFHYLMNDLLLHEDDVEIIGNIYEEVIS